MNNRYRFKKSEFFFWIGMLLQFSMSVWLITTQEISYSIYYVLGIMLCFGIKIIHTRYTAREFYIILFLFSISVAAYVAQGDSKVLRIVFMLVAAKDIPYKRLLRFLMVVYCLLIVFIPFRCLVFGKGIISIYGTFGIGRKAGTRYMLGFDGPNRLVGIWMCLLAAFCLVREKRILKWDMIALVISIVFYKLTLSRTGLIGCMILILFPYIISIMPGIIRKMFQKKVLIWAVLAGLIITFLAIWSYGPLMEKLNVAFNNRFFNLSNIYQSKEISLFGDKTDYNIYGGGMDNSYFAVLFTSGIVPTLIYMAGLYKCIRAVARTRNLTEIAVTLTFILLAFVQEMIDVPFVNFMFFIFMGNWESIFSEPLFSRGSKMELRDIKI